MTLAVDILSLNKVRNERHIVSTLYRAVVIS